MLGPCQQHCGHFSGERGCCITTVLVLARLSTLKTISYTLFCALLQAHMLPSGQQHLLFSLAGVQQQ
jgi:hypothetical protein